MAEVSYAVSYLTADDTNSTNVYADADVLAGSGLTNGEVYLLLVRATFRNENGGASTAVKCVHGSTDFVDSEHIMEGYGGVWSQYNYWDVFTQASTEDIKVQFKSMTDTVDADIDEIIILAISLTDAGFEADTDYHFAERATDDTIDDDDFDLNIDGASITFTPSDTGQEWLILSLSQLDSADSNRQHESRINIDDSDTDTWKGQEAEDTTQDKMVLVNIRPMPAGALDDSEHTILEQSRLDGSGSTTRYHSKILAIQLDAHFVDVSQLWTAGSVGISNTWTWPGTNVATLEFTPTGAGNIAVLGGSAYNSGASDDVGHRMQIEESDLNGWDLSTAAYRNRRWDSTDRVLYGWASVEDVAASAQTLDVDVMNEDDTDGTCTQRYIVAFSLELIDEGGTDRAAEVSAFELEAPDAPRAAEVSAFEFETADAPRAAEVSAFELEVPTAPRAAEVSAFEMEVPTAPRAAEVSAFELEAPDIGRAAEVSAFELETPDADRAAEVSAFELETPDAARAAEVSAFEFEVADAPRAAEVSAFELEVPTAPRAAEVSAFELQSPDAPRAAEVSAFELEAPIAPRAAEVSAFELEAPDADRAAEVSAFELETPNADRAAEVSAFEFETAPAPRAAEVSAFELVAPETDAGDVLESYITINIGVQI